MASKLPLYVPVAIAERRAYTVDVYLCDNSAALDSPNLSVYSTPVFTKTYSVNGFRNSYAREPTEIWFTAGEPLRKMVTSQWYTATDDAALFRTGLYPVFSLDTPVSYSSLPWTYANGTLSVTFNQGTAFPLYAVGAAANLEVDQFGFSYVPTQYVWSAVLSYTNGKFVYIVDKSPIKIDLTAEDLPTQAKELSICSAKVLPPPRTQLPWSGV